MDLAKTNFLIVEGFYSTTITAYRRKRATVVLDEHGCITGHAPKSFRELRKKYPDACDRWRTTTVWTLVPITTATPASQMRVRP